MNPMDKFIKLFNNSNVQTVNYNVTCPMCNNINTMIIDRDGALKYSQGEHIQNAFPDLSDSERELLLTGICNNCWNELFNDEED